ncbi:Bug family tripartite tricarboxylate transporter substrate binding protein [Ramlibacter rhizophilus]|uniref:Tripartite tricarboxylate transporter substrate binding protein n=1 Tax=Ramlibacter rhizophilus TaxID=1781167 RepID=A0A4Z0BG70_9BURK|nr:tripartite tricarboxylate transporter substrate binding protein [Ramlibacter rhizophilus]TFY97287.1 tripartite tricarboxylate transporter substrate binding protein [Ramlibacter rhizophilus]
MNRRSLVLVAALAASASLAPLPAAAAWPDKPISLVVPYAPGGTADALARLIAQHLGPKLNTNVVVVNKAGASGIIGASSVAQASPDGYTVLYDATPLSINPHLQKMPFDPQKDLAPVSLVAVTPMLLVVPKSSPYNSLQELIKAGKEKPGKLTFSSGGQGTVQYMGAELFSQGAGVKMLHVPYKSGGPGLMAIVSGEVDLGFGNLPALTGHVNNGLVKPLAITSGQRNANFPNVPTIAESAVKGYETYEWNGMFVPSGTPPDVVNRLQVAVKEVLAIPEVKAKFDNLGSRVVASTPEEFRKYLGAESEKWAATVKSADIKKE